MAPEASHYSPTTMSATDTTPLLENGDVNGHPQTEPFTKRTLRLLKAEGEPSWAASYKYFWFGAWLNILLVFVPLSFIAHHLHWDAALRFVFSFIAIMPLAKVSYSYRYRVTAFWLNFGILAFGRSDRPDVDEIGTNCIRSPECIVW